MGAGHPALLAALLPIRWGPGSTRLVKAATRRLGRTPEGIDGPVNRLVAARRAGGRAGEASRDLLQVLLEARDEDGRPLTDAEIGDEVATFLLAGHRRPASVGTV